MTKEVRQGLALFAVAGVFLLLSFGGGAVGTVMRMGALLFAIGGLILLAVGLLRPERDQMK